MTDQLIADTLSCYGGNICQTPNLRKLAEQSAVFTKAYTTAPLCSPARASIFTGKYPNKHGLLYNSTHAAYGRPELSDSSSMISIPLKNAGYRCGYVGKWHIGESLGPVDYGFEGTRFAGYGLPSDFVSDYDEYLKENGHPGQKFVEVKDFIGTRNIDSLNMPLSRSMPSDMIPAEQYAGIIDLPVELTPAGFVASRTIDLLNAFKDDPFFLTASFWGPHHPALPNKEFAGTHSPDAIEAWANYNDELNNKPRIQSRYIECLNQRFNREGWPLWSKVIASHFDFMTMIDSQIGLILNELDRLGLKDNTMIIFTADHGDSLGCHGGLWDKGPYSYEEIMRIPLLARMPGKTEMSLTDAPVSNMDIYSTVLDYCGAQRPDYVDSESFLRVAEGKTAKTREVVMTQFYGFDTRGLFLQRSIISGNLKYVFNPSDIDEFYDLTDDPYEMTNAIDNPSKISDITAMKKLLLGEMRKVDDPYLAFASQLMKL